VITSIKEGYNDFVDHVKKVRKKREVSRKVSSQSVCIEKGKQYRAEIVRECTGSARRIDLSSQMKYEYAYSMKTHKNKQSFFKSEVGHVQNIKTFLIVF
jgi:hypothetical protein